LYESVIGVETASGWARATHAGLGTSAKAGVPLGQGTDRLTDRVIRIDLYPVAVALVRVTYLLAIGRARLVDRSRGPITMPVYLGDSVQWTQWVDLPSEAHGPRIRVAPPPAR
jgi:hypothetical protein